MVISNCYFKDKLGKIIMDFVLACMYGGDQGMDFVKKRRGVVGVGHAEDKACLTSREAVG